MAGQILPSSPSLQGENILGSKERLDWEMSIRELALESMKKVARFYLQAGAEDIYVVALGKYKGEQFMHKLKPEKKDDSSG